MKTHAVFVFSCLLPFTIPASGEIMTLVEHTSNHVATSAFKFKEVPAPSTSDAASRANFRLVDGERDEIGGELDALHDGRLPRESDQPTRNFFFAAATKGGRLLIDLRHVIEINQINTYSWHTSMRSPQVYTLYASDGKAADFKSAPKRGTDPKNCAWKLLSEVDTRSKSEEGGQVAVSISDSNAPLGKYRYLLLDISPTETNDAFGNTFFSEIDVISSDPAAAVPPPYLVHCKDRSCEIALDTFEAPELEQWATNKLAPVLAEWYPKIVAMLPSEGYAAPKAFHVLIKPGRGVAATGGTNVTANSTWLQRELNGEAIGAILHEEVHVIQQYGWRRRNPEAKPTPGWLTEGIPDYIRWFKYEPQSHGADITWLRRRRNLTLRHDAGYRITANFLNYVVEQYDKDIIQKLNAACRHGSYSETIWKNSTGKTIEELNEEWTTAIRAELARDDSKSQP